MFSFNVGAIWRICKLHPADARAWPRIGGALQLDCWSAGLEGRADLFGDQGGGCDDDSHAGAEPRGRNIRANCVCPGTIASRWPRPASPSPGEKRHRSSAGRRSSLRIRWAEWGCRPRWRQLSAICWTMRRASPSAPRLRSTEAALPKLRSETLSSSPARRAGSVPQQRRGLARKRRGCC